MKKISTVFRLLIAGVFSAFLVLPAVPVHAAFDRNLIMSDNIFDSSGSMSAAQIDTFLNGLSSSCISTNSGFEARVPSGYSPSGGFTYGGFTSAGQVIATSAQVYGINPQVLLATLQKEQSLVSGSSSYCNNGDEHKYAAAMGYGCPDGGSHYSYTGVSLYRRGGVERTATGQTCVNSSDKAGFSQQVIRGAWLLKFGQQRSLGNINWAVITGSWDNSDDPQSCYGGPVTQGYRKICPSGSTDYYDGQHTIDGTAIHIDSGATAALYWYTPHFSGNQNFVNIFETWFGKTVSATSLIWEPTVVSQTTGKINAFARGADRRLWQTWYSDGAWQTNWNYLDGVSPSSSAPSSISWGDGHMDVFETRNGSIWHTWYKNDGTGWRWWTPIGKPAGVSLGGTVAAVSQAPGKINLFARGSDGRLWQTWYDNGNWRGWNYIEGPTPNALAPAAVSWANGHMDVFELRDGNVWHSWYNADSTGWRGWSKLGRPTGSNLKKSLAVTSQAPGKINLFARGEGNNVLWQTWYSSGAWRGWNYIDGSSPGSSSPAAFSWANGHMDVFDLKGGTLWHSWYNADSTGWRNWSWIGRP